MLDGATVWYAGLTAVLVCSVAGAGEWSGYVAAETRLFPEAPLDSTQHEENLSLSFQPEYYHEWAERRESILFIPFLRIDQHDSERSHADIRELCWQKSATNWELRLGVRKVFWGVTESQHLVDIINQTDLVESPDGEEKLGELMLDFAWINDWGTLDFFVMPGFRERTFPGSEGRFRTPIPMDLDHAQYESSLREFNTDLAVRYSHSIGDWDIGLSHFYGTCREPRFLPYWRENGFGDLSSLGQVDFRSLVTLADILDLKLRPYYDVINQTGVDVQFTRAGWLLKLESILRIGQDKPFAAATAGLEYTFSSLFNSGIDLGLLAEYLFDSRLKTAQTPFSNDFFAGTRLSFNDKQSTHILAGVIVDPETAALAIGLEAERRLWRGLKLSLESRIFSGVPRDDPLSSYQKDDYFQFVLAWYF